MVKKGHPRKMRSKRLTLSKKYRIQKKVKEHKRKATKAAKSNTQWKSRKDPGIPNLAPFKEAILREAEERKLKMIENKKKNKTERRKVSKLERMREDAESRQNTFQGKNVSNTSKSSGKSKDLVSSRKAYFREVKKVVDSADVLIEVLDARDPLGTRCLQLEKEIMASGTNKKLVLLLNKIDLVPKPLVEKWLKYLRKEFPTVAFKASTQNQKKNLSHFRYVVLAAPKKVMSSSQCLGATALIKLLNNYCRSDDIKTTISVGIVGYPNVGKSSIINSLKRKKACNVGDTPGITKSMQEVTLAKNIKLLDCPGVVLSNTNSEVTMVLRNCVKIDSISDVLAPIEVILAKCNREQLMLHYSLSEFSGTEEFLGLMAIKKGKFKKGGIPNIIQAAKSVLQDWNSGNLPYYTSPPEEHILPSHVKIEIVHEFSKQFKMGGIKRKDGQLLDELPEVGPGRAVEVQPSEALKILDLDGEGDNVVEEQVAVPMESGDDSGDHEDTDEEDMEASGDDNDEELNNMTVDLPTKKSPAESAKARGKELKQLMEAKANLKATRVPLGNQQLNKSQKKAFKKVIKKRKRVDKVAVNLSDDLTRAMSSLGGSGGDTYNFDDIFK